MFDGTHFDKTNGVVVKKHRLLGSFFGRHYPWFKLEL